MILNLSPQRRDAAPTVSVAGDVLTVDGASYDFSSLAEGDVLAAGVVPCAWITGPVTRAGGHIVVTLILPHGPAPSAAVSNPEPITVTVDGPVTLPSDPEPVEADDVEP